MTARPVHEPARVGVTPTQICRTLGGWAPAGGAETRPVATAPRSHARFPWGFPRWRPRHRGRPQAAWSPPAPVPDNDQVADPWIASVRYSQLLAPRPPEVRRGTHGRRLFPTLRAPHRADLVWHGGWWQWSRH